jgi:enterochelin esterase-like enzyme
MKSAMIGLFAFASLLDVARAGAQGAKAGAEAGNVVAYSRTGRPGMATGELREFTLFDSVFKRDRRIWVYTPAGYPGSTLTGYDLIVAFDGADYRDTIPLPMILDTLTAGRHVPPFVAVMVDDSSGAVRLNDLANRARFVDFLAAQLVPWVRRGWNVTTDPGRTIITGSSAGGLAAANAALAHPELFGNVLAQSGAFWRGNEASSGPPFEWLTTRVAELPKRDVRFLLDIGALETGRTIGGRGPVFIEAVRRFRDALAAKGYVVDYTEVPEAAHAPVYWRARLPQDIVALSSSWTRDSTRATPGHR